MRYSSRFFLYAPFLALFALAVAAMLRWWHVADEFEGKLRAANSGHEIAPGVTLHFTSGSVGGFPFNLDAVLENVAISVESTRGPFVWRAEHFAVHALTYGRAQEIFEAAGTQTFSWTDTQGVTHRFSFVPGSLHASAISAGDRLLRFDLDVTGFAGREISGARLQLNLRRAPARDAIDVAVRADDVHLASDLRAGFGAVIARMTITGGLTPSTQFSPLLAGRDEWRKAAEKWRLHAGSFLLDRMEIVWGRLHTEGTGTLSLDDRHRPAGTMNLKLTHAESLAASGAEEGRLAHALMGLSKDNSSTAPLRVIVSFKGGEATLNGQGMPELGVGSLDGLY